MMFTTALEVRGNGKTASKWLRLAICTAALLSTIGFATSASAWTYTLVDPITIDGSNNGGTGVLGTINLVSGYWTNPTPTSANSPTSDTAGVVLDNSADKTLQDFVWFSISLDVGSTAIHRIQASMGPPLLGAGGTPSLDPEHFSFSSFNTPPVGAGYYNQGGDVSPNGGTSVAIDTGVGGFAQYNWDYGSVSTNNLEAGDTSADLLWVGELLVSGGQGVIYNNTINFMIEAVGGGGVFDVPGVVPEPGTGLLLGGGLIGMTLKRRRETRAIKAAQQAKA